MSKKKIFLLLLDFIIIVFFANFSYKSVLYFKNKVITKKTTSPEKLSKKKEVITNTVEVEMAEKTGENKIVSYNLPMNTQSSDPELALTSEVRKEGEDSFTDKNKNIFTYALEIDFMLHQIAIQCRLSKDYINYQKQELRTGLDRNYLYIEEEIDIVDEEILHKFLELLEKHAFFGGFTLHKEDKGNYKVVTMEKDGFKIFSLKIKTKLEEEKGVEVSRVGKLAIIVDDMGKGTEVTRKFIQLPSVLTLSFIPHFPQALDEALLAKKRGHLVMLHIPMETVSGHFKIEKGKGITVKMSDKEIENYLEKVLAIFSFVKGANNHMGSLATQNLRVMRAVFRVLKRRKLFFIDSRTTSKSVAEIAARETQIYFSKRDVFLDNVRTQKAIEKMLKHAIYLAKKHGSAIAICHPYKETYEVLKKYLKEQKRKDIIFVSADKLVNLVE